MNMQESSDAAVLLRDLRGRIAMLERGQVGPRGREDRFATGHAGVDRALGGGLARGRLHEFYAADSGDDASVHGLALMLALRACAGGKAAGQGAILWLRTQDAVRGQGGISGEGLCAIGVDPARMLIGIMPDEKMLLRCAADAARCEGLGCLLVDCPGRAPMLDLTASRRLVLAAERSGVTLFLIRGHGPPQPSAAESRWDVAAAPSTGLAQGLAMDAPGAPAFDVRLLRRRSGPDGLTWRMEWDRDSATFRDAPLSGAILPLSADGSAAAGVAA